VTTAPLPLVGHDHDESSPGFFPTPFCTTPLCCGCPAGKTVDCVFYVPRGAEYCVCSGLANWVSGDVIHSPFASSIPLELRSSFSVFFACRLSFPLDPRVRLPLLFRPSSFFTVVDLFFLPPFACVVHSYGPRFSREKLLPP